MSNTTKEHAPLLEALRTRFEKKEPIATQYGMRLLMLGYEIAEMSMPITRRLINSNGCVMGGIITMLADMAAAYATMTLVAPHEISATKDMHIDFIEPSLLEESRLFAVAEAKRTEQNTERGTHSTVMVYVHVYTAKFFANNKQKNFLKAEYNACFPVLPKETMNINIHRVKKQIQ